MVNLFEERLKSEIEGTIIDFETIGSFDRRHNDSRHYQFISPVIFGYLHNEGLTIHYIEKKKDIHQLTNFMALHFQNLMEPFYAFNCEFESGVVFHSCELTLDFYELNSKKYERKRDVVRELGIESYHDPFDGDGKKCMEAWLLGGDIEECIKHNRACLLKERDILLKRGYRRADEMQFISTDS